MRQGQQNRRGRGGRHNNNAGNQHRKGQNPLTRSFESNGPDVKIRGTPAHVAEKYISLARDALSSGDRVLAENYLQHAEHYNRIILTYREQHMGQHNDAAGRFRVPGMADFEGGDDAGEEDVEEAGEQTPRGLEPQPQTGAGPGRGDDRGERHARHDRQDRFDRPRHERQHRHGEQRFDSRREQYRQDQPRQQDQPGEGRRDVRGDDRPDQRPDTRPDTRNDARGDGRSEGRFEGRGESRPPEGRYEGGRGEGRGRYRERDRGDREQPQRTEQPRGEQPPVPAVTEGGSSGEQPQRSESPRRRERFVEPQDDQPAFLRRPVRRSRREASEEGSGVAEAVESSDGKPAA